MTERESAPARRRLLLGGAATGVQRGSFVIGGAQPRQRICWQLTGVRADQWALQHPLEVEGDKHDPPWWDPA